VEGEGEEVHFGSMLLGCCWWCCVVQWVGAVEMEMKLSSSLEGRLACEDARAWAWSDVCMQLLVSIFDRCSILRHNIVWHIQKYLRRFTGHVSRDISEKHDLIKTVTKQNMQKNRKDMNAIHHERLHNPASQASVVV
jgi:hypothetical protein